MVTQSLVLFGLATSSALAASLNHPFIKRQDNCYHGGSSTTCSVYCEASSVQITGPPQNASGHITCDTSSCSNAVSQTQTVTQSFTISIGADASAGEDAIKGGASTGASWSWSTSSATSTTQTFNLEEGDAGNIVFRPYYQQSCGDMKYYYLEQSDGGDGVAGSDYCDSDPYGEDTNACGQTPILRSDGFADGDTTFCYTAPDSKAGQGC